MSSCYSIAWLFHFKMSPNTNMQAHWLRRLFTFSPVQLSFELSIIKASSDAGGRAIFFATSLHKVSSVTEVRCVDILFPLHITWQILGSYSIIEFRKETINNSDHYPTSYTPFPAIRPACSDYTRSLLTTQFA